ncbi:tRNA pseudouridine(38-40) synthase TruA [Chitinivorax sp. B]|uniref:tRNA pseudouridine(38-40) synthase TruA n=1 Tax=Chitinivorax sp. B TaxID=2502235 RepID=UPI0010F63402|nr:tRNA pseudouridine(38-40) synthase TruA [Chitinivorax sp. B]
MRLALGLEYLGRGFSGWQSQPAGCTIQDTLEFALGQIAGETIRVVAAGRTDAGVNASMQVVHFDTQAERPLTAWVRGVNRFLPEEIAVLWAREVDDAFHARFCATARRYRYMLLNRGVRPALLRGGVGWCHNPLNVHGMQMAANILIGEHDFSAFRAAECQAKSPIKHLYQLDIRRQGALIQLDLRANAFLHHMVRNIVGCLIQVGAGRRSSTWLEDVLASRDRKLAAPTFSPDGLYLSGVDYENVWGLGDLTISDAREVGCDDKGRV